MRKIYFVLLLLSCSVFGLKSQDISFFHRDINDRFQMPPAQWGMSMDEFQLLSREVRLMDWFYGAVVPGYVHFKAKDKAMGYTLTGIRVLGYAGLSYVLLQSKSFIPDLINGNYAGPNYEGYKYLSDASLVLVFGSYLFDMIHGNYRLKRKQELIRYKYSTKLKLAASHNELSLRYDPPQMPVFGLAFSF